MGTKLPAVVMETKQVTITQQVSKIQLWLIENHIQGPPEKTLVPFSYDSVKSIDAMKLKFSAIKVNI